MRTFIPTLLTASIMFIPSLSLAQPATSVPPPAIAGSHPNAVPPTKAPTKPLPPAPLPVAGASAASSGEGNPSAPAVASSSTTGSSMIFIILVGAAFLLVVGLGWFALRRKKTIM